MRVLAHVHLVRWWSPSLLLILWTTGGCADRAIHLATDPATTSRSAIAAASEDSDAAETEEQAWKSIAGVLGRQGTAHDSVYTIVVPRDDLYVTVEEMSVPTAAGIESRFNFYHCSCGKTSVIGEFVVTDYEANDVMETLLGKQFTVASVAPFLLHEHPRLLSVHFKGEGRSADVADVLKQALGYTGKERDAPATNIAPAR